MQSKTILIYKSTVVRWTSGWLAASLLAGCSTALLPSDKVPLQDQLQAASWQQRLQQLPASAAPALLLLGEQHDAPEHHAWERTTTQTLVERQQLAAVVLEMTDQGLSTHHLPRTATETQVQQALRWNDQGWPWKAYGPTVMTAVRAGIPVVGGNLPKAQMKDVMQQPHWDQHLPPTAWEQQRDAIRTGHCNLLPEKQLTPMARIQLAKDARMAQTAQSLLQPERTVLLIAGRGHVLRSIGIPTWLPASVAHTIAIGQAGETEQAASTERDYVVRTAATPPKDHCAALRAQWATPPSSKP